MLGSLLPVQLWRVARSSRTCATSPRSQLLLLLLRRPRGLDLDRTYCGVLLASEAVAPPWHSPPHSIYYDLSQTLMRESVFRDTTCTCTTRSRIASGAWEKDLTCALSCHWCVRVNVCWRQQKRDWKRIKMEWRANKKKGLEKWSREMAQLQKGFWTIWPWSFYRTLHKKVQFSLNP